jgi:ATP-dependent Zn protease
MKYASSRARKHEPVTWDPTTWKRPLRFLLGLATIWPIIYMALFFVLIFSGVLFGAMFGESPSDNSSRLDLIQLEKKIQAGDIKELTVRPSEIRAVDHNGREFRTDVDNEATRDDIIGQARELDANQRPRVAKVRDETGAEPRVTRILPVGFAMIFLLHLFTILLLFILMPLYIIFPINNQRLDQTMRIVWVVLACTVGMFADPVYWYLYVWRKPSEPAAPAQQSTT